MKREDDFEDRRQHLKGLSEKELEERFWQLANQIVDPLIELAENNTSPSIERSVLLRMGFSSLEAKGIVDEVVKMGLLGKGAGNVVYKLSRLKNVSIKDAGQMVIEGNCTDEIVKFFKGGNDDEARA